MRGFTIGSLKNYLYTILRVRYYVYSIIPPQSPILTINAPKLVWGIRLGSPAHTLREEKQALLPITQTPE